MGRRRGATLLEMIVVMTVFTLALALFYRILNVGLLSYRRLDPRLDAQRSLLVACGALSRELMISRASAVVLDYPGGNPANGDLALAFPTPRDPATHQFRVDLLQQIPEYQAQIVYYRNPADNSLRRGQVPLAPPSVSPGPMSVAGLRALVVANADPQKLANVESFQAREVATGLPIQVAAVRMNFRLVVRPPQGDVLELTVPVSLLTTEG